MVPLDPDETDVESPKPFYEGFADTAQSHDSHGFSHQGRAARLTDPSIRETCRHAAEITGKPDHHVNPQLRHGIGIAAAVRGDIGNPDTPFPCRLDIDPFKPGTNLLDQSQPIGRSEKWLRDEGHGWNHDVVTSKAL